MKIMQRNKQVFKKVLSEKNDKMPEALKLSVKETKAARGTSKAKDKNLS